MDDRYHHFRNRTRRLSPVLVGIAAWAFFVAGSIPQTADLTPERLLRNLASKNFTGKPMTIRVAAGSLKSAFAEIQKISGLRFDLDFAAAELIRRTDFERNIIIGNQMPWDAVLDSILREFGLGIAVEGDRIAVRSTAGSLEKVGLSEPKSKSLSWIWLIVLAGGLAAFGGWIFVARKKNGLHRGRVKFALDAKPAEEIKTKILYLFEVEKAYRDENLSLQAVSTRLGLPPHHVSWVANGVLGQTFSRLVNSYRIDEVKRRLGDSADAGRTILEIAFEAGFNTKTAFNRTFKQQTGMTPSEFREKTKA
jgi:AraC-like DNA-binding protein